MNYVRKKISRQDTVRIKFFVDSGFLICSMIKKKTRKSRESIESLLNQKATSVNGLPLLENCLKTIIFFYLSAILALIKKGYVQASMVSSRW